MDNDQTDAAQFAALGTTRLHGCNGRPRPTPETSYLAQDGYHEPFECPPGVWNRLPKYKQIFHVMSIPCGYIESVNDSACNGCYQKREATK